MEPSAQETPLELLLIRHGESTYNRDGTGGLNSELTELGVEQARRLAPWLAASFKFSAIYSSPLVRSRQTAELATAGLSLPVQWKEDLREVDFELGPGLPHYADPIAAFTSEPPSMTELPARYAEFVSRVTRAFCEILAENKQGTILIFTHGGVIATFLRTIFGAHQVSVYADNCSALLLRWRNSRWYLVYSNHLV